ncbi:uncharacterized protein [Triticum aestivum]|uniref:uncharacterized protein n=1 Tax=Triticum aestivum TaxID=4565 RepID=UPI001D022096|nr:uncharacterized protein LOC123067328 [Triticum aestivum]
MTAAHEAQFLVGVGVVRHEKRAAGMRSDPSGWYVAWRTVLVHVPLVQEVAGLRPKKKPAKPKPPNRGRIGRFYQSQAQAQR